MIRVDLSEIVPRRGRDGTTVLFPVINESPALRRSMLAELRRFVKAVSELVREIIIPAFTSRIVRDASHNDFDRLTQLAQALMDSTGNRIKQLMELDANRHTSEFMSSARSAFGVDLSAVITQGDLTDLLDAKALQNAGLIKGMGDDLVKRVQVATTSSMVAGERVGQLRKRLKHEFGLTDVRAARIARDQTNKLNADLTRVRHEQVGVVDYVWRTSKDERVRSRHRGLDGRTFKYGESTPAENGGSPGQPIECRCIGQGVVVFGNEPLTKPKTFTHGSAPEYTATNAAGAEAWVIEHIADKSAFTKTTSAKKLKPFLQAIAVASSHFKSLGKLQAVASASKAGVKSKALAFYMPGRNTILVNPSGLKNDVKSHPVHLAKYKAAQEAGLKKSSDEVVKRASKMTDQFDWFVLNGDRVRSTAFHEYGHRFHDVHRVAIDEILRAKDFTADGWPWLSGKYAMTNRSEYVAEMMSLYLTGDDHHFRIYPPLLKFFKSKDDLNG